MTLKEEVTNVLTDYPDTRNNDALLAVYVWWKRKPSSFKKIEDRWYVDITSVANELPREDAIKRIRAHIQNDKKQFLPTDNSILAKRAKRASNWREEIIYGY